MPGDGPKGVIFDMDGVLIDSFEAHFDSWRRLAAEEGREYTRAQFVAGFGRTSREVIAEQWGPGPLSEECVRKLDDRKEALFREIVSRSFPAMDGATELIASLVKAQFRVAVGSSGPPANVRLAIERLGIGSNLSAVVTGEDVHRGKPDPEVFQLAAKRMAVPPARCVVVEDAPVGIEAARRGQMRSIGLASTGRTADLVVTSLRELTPERFDQLICGGS